MLDRAFLAAIGIFGIITFCIFCMVIFREFWRTLIASVEKARRMYCRNILFPAAGISDVSIQSARSKFPMKIIEQVVDKYAQTNSLSNQERIALFERTGVIDYFIQALQNAKHWNDRARAALSLGKTGSGKALQSLIGAIEDGEEDEAHVKTAAAHALALIRDTSAVVGLAKALGCYSERVSSSVSEALILLGELSYHEINKTLKTRRISGRVGYWLIATCGKLKSPLFVESLLEHLNNPDPEIRAVVVDSLGQIKDKRAVHPLIFRMLNDPIAGVRTSAAQSLGKIGDDRALDSLLQALADPDYHTQSRAVEALEMLGEKSRSALQNTMFDARPEVRFRAATALVRMGTVHQSLQQLSVSDFETRRKALTFLTGLIRAGVIESVLEGLKDNDFRIRSRLCQIFGDLNESRAIEPLLECTRDEMWPVQVQAIRALAKIEMTVFEASHLEEFLESENEDIRWAAVSALIRVKECESERLLVSLEKLINDKNSAVRLSVIEYLGRLKSVKAVQLVHSVIKDPRALVRVAACKAMGAIGKKDSLDLLTGMLSDPEEPVRSAAANGLAGLGKEQGIHAIIENLDRLPVAVASASLWQISGGNLASIADVLMGGTQKKARRVLVALFFKARDARYTRLVRLLISDPDPRVAGVAIQLAGMARDEEALPHIKSVCHSGAPETRRKAVEALGYIGTQAAADCMLPQLGREDEPLRGEILIALGRMGLDASEAAIVPFLSNSNDELRVCAVLALGLLGTATAFQAALPPFSETHIRDAVLKRLEEEPGSVVERFLKTFNLHHGRYAKERAKGLAGLDGIYMKDLRDAQSVPVRIRAAQALGLIRSPGCLPVLKRTAKEDPNDAVRAQAISALGRISHGDEILEWMNPALRDPAPLVRRSALPYLNCLKPDKVNPVLIETLHSGEEFVHQDVLELLIKLNKNDPDILMDLAMSEQNPELAALFIEQLTPHMGKNKLRLLGAMCRHEVDTVRAAAVKALSADGSLDVLPRVLREAAQDPSTVVRLSLIRHCSLKWLTALNGELHQFLKDPVSSVRREAKARLKELQGK